MMRPGKYILNALRALINEEAVDSNPFAWMHVDAAHEFADAGEIYAPPAWNDPPPQSRMATLVSRGQDEMVDEMVACVMDCIRSGQLNS